MNLAILTDTTLLSDIKILVGKEKDYTLKILYYLRAIDDRKAFADLGYGSLFSYCVEELGYSEQEAYIRINAMRLIQNSPEAEKRIREGKINLTQASEIQKYLKKDKDRDKNGGQAEGKGENQESKDQDNDNGKNKDKDKDHNLHLDQKKTLEEKTLSLLDEVQGKSTRETKNFLSGLEGKGPSPVILKISQEVWVMLKTIQEKKGKFTMEETLRSLCASELGKEDSRGKDSNHGPEQNQNIKSPKKIKTKVQEDKGPKEQNKNRKISSSNPMKEKNLPPKSSSRYIPRPVREQIWRRSGGQCEFYSNINDKRCSQKLGLEFHHIFPFGHGGPTILENLKLYCRNHNQRAGIEFYGKMKLESGSFSGKG